MKFKEYLKQPATLRKAVIWVFTLWMIWSSLSFQIQSNDERISDIEAMHIDVAIMQIQTDLARIRKALEEK